MAEIIKRLMDLGGALAGLIIFAPVLVLMAVLIRLNMGCPILFCQRRPGLHGQPFTLLKFRTLTNDVDPCGNLLPDAERLTRFGQFLRSTSFDELPELFSVLKGEMSLVGPRPLLMEYLDRYTAEQSRRHEVKPGITGWAQVNGRNAVAWEEKFKLDLWYVDNRTFWLDLEILLVTLLKVFKAEGISAKGHATMLEFKGSQSAEQ